MVDPCNAVDVQMGAQLTTVRRWLRMQLVKEPLSIAPEVVRRVGYGALRAALVEQLVPLTKEERVLWESFCAAETPRVDGISTSKKRG